jgi:N-acetylneuraminic acid mutarotase
MMGERRAVLILMLILCSLLVALPNIEIVWAAEDSWVSKAPMQEARIGLGVAVVNDKIYAIGGVGPGSGTGGFCAFNEEYDPATDTWTFKASMPTPRSLFGIAVYQDRIYCMGGYTIVGLVGVKTDVNEVYDPATDTWETKTSMPSARLGLQANIVKDKIYLIGGYESVNGTSVGVSNRTDVYDPATDTWTSKASIPTPVSYSASAVVDNKIYVMTSGLNQIYDTESDSWSTGAPAPMPLFSASAGTTQGVLGPERIYAFGANAAMPYYQFNVKNFPTQSYDPKNNNWTVCTSMPTGRFSTGVAVLNDSFYVIGGYTLEGGYTPEQWSPSTVPSAVNEQYTPVESIPEFPSWIILPLFAITAFLVAVFRKKLSSF